MLQIQEGYWRKQDFFLCGYMILTMCIHIKLAFIHVHLGKYGENQHIIHTYFMYKTYLYIIILFSVDKHRDWNLGKCEYC